MDSKRVLDGMDGNANDDAGMDTFHDFRTVTRVSSWAKGVSWVCLGLFIALAVGTVIDVAGALIGYNQLPGYLWMTLDRSTVPLVTSAGGFVILQAVAEAMYILLDIEENTRGSPPGG